MPIFSPQRFPSLPTTPHSLLFSGGHLALSLSLLIVPGGEDPASWAYLWSPQASGQKDLKKLLLLCRVKPRLITGYRAMQYSWARKRESVEGSREEERRQRATSTRSWHVSADKRRPPPLLPPPSTAPPTQVLVNVVCESRLPRSSRPPHRDTTQANCSSLEFALPQRSARKVRLKVRLQREIV